MCARRHVMTTQTLLRSRKRAQHFGAATLMDRCVCCISAKYNKNDITHHSVARDCQKRKAGLANVRLMEHDDEQMLHLPPQ